jgi:hypothetical protein
VAIELDVSDILPQSRFGECAHAAFGLRALRDWAIQFTGKA